VYRYDTTRGWREVLADGKEIPVISVRRPSVSQVQLLDESLAAMEKSGVFTPEELATARKIRDKWWTSTEPSVEKPLKTGDVVWVSASVPFGVTGHVSDVNSTNLCKVQIPGGFTVENAVDLAVAGVSIVTGAHMMYVAPGTVIDTAWPEFKFLGGARRHVVKVRKLRGVESTGFFVPVPRGWNVRAGENVWARLRATRELAYGVLAPPVAAVKPKLPRVRKKDFRLRFKRADDGYVAVLLQRLFLDGWQSIKRYDYRPVPK
jgi:hypothetical protein